MPGSPQLSGVPKMTALGLTDLTSGRVYQRSGTSRSVALAGTYSGSGARIEARVLLAADSSVVVDWTNVNASFSGGNWSGAITVPQGGAYTVQVRCSPNRSLSASGSNQWFVGIVTIVYGQSNSQFFTARSTSPPALASNARFFDGSAWTTTVGNGAAEYMNAMATSTSVPQGLLNGAVSGQSLTSLSKGNISGYYTDLMTQVTNAGGDAEFILYQQGEAEGLAVGDASWETRLDTLHGDIATDIGRTKTTIPMLVASLSTTSDAVSGTDVTWQSMKTHQVNMNTGFTGAYYSHSNMDGALVDQYHWDGASYGRAGKRFAQTAAKALGLQSQPANWFATSAAVVDATHTDVTLTHKLGTDFTPTSGITGFEVSSDGGSSWNSATGARQSATVIRLTHASLGVGQKTIRYQYGKAPTITSMALDNSSLAVPLNFTATNLVTS